MMKSLPLSLSSTVLAAVLAVVVFGGVGKVWAGTSYQPPLTQADIDAYVYLLPRLTGPDPLQSDAAALALRESGLSRQRAAYVGIKVALAEAMVEGFMTPDRLAEENLPSYLQPSAEELSLVSDNLETIKKARRSSLAQGPN